MASPLNLDILDTNAYIEQNKTLPVTSVFIRHSSSTEFDNKGLFSEEIFGQVGTPERLVKFGYIDLNCKLLHPIIYNNILKLTRWYGELMSGKTYAVFNDKLKVFEKSTAEEGDTGFLFFINHLHKLDFGSSKSLAQQDKINIINKNKHKLTIDKMLVIPAGWRDVTVDEARVDKDSINKLYVSLINYAKSLPTGVSLDDIYSGIMFAMQKKVCEIFQYLFNIAEGKRGFFQNKYGSRNLALGTRNVISLSNMAAMSPDSPEYLKIDEVGVPVFQAAKMYMPLTTYALKTYFLNETFSMSADNVALVNKKTLKLEYVPVSEEEKNRFLSSDGIEKIVNLFRDKATRNLPITVYGEDDIAYYLYLIYDTGDDIYKTRSVEELKETLRDLKVPFNPKYLRPMTYGELIYMGVYFATIDKYAYITRYPAIGIGSCIPCKTHVLTTTPSRLVRFYLKADTNSVQIQELFKNRIVGKDMQALTTVVGSGGTATNVLTLPKYPIVTAKYADSTSVHPAIIGGARGLGADFDGDTVTASGMLSVEATDENRKYLESKERYIAADGKFYATKTDIAELTLFNLSRDPK